MRPFLLISDEGKNEEKKKKIDRMVVNAVFGEDLNLT